jgi:hypothetical protein
VSALAAAVVPTVPVRAKGVNFRGAMKQLERRGGKALLERVLARVEGEAGVAMRTGEIVTGGWYPASWYDALLAAIEVEYPSDRTAIRTLTREAVTDDFKTIFKILSLVVSPSAALRNGAKVMARYWEGGRVALVEAHEGYAHFVFEDYLGFTPRIWDDVIGGIEAVVDMMDLVRLPIETRGATADGRRLEVIVRYRF